MVRLVLARRCRLRHRRPGAYDSRHSEPRSPGRPVIARMFVRTVLFMALEAAVLFVAAGTIEWPEGWAFLAILGGSSLGIGVWLLRHDPALLAERMGPMVQPRQVPWDKAVMLLTFLVWHAWLAFVAVDAMRERWS